MSANDVIPDLTLALARLTKICTTSLAEHGLLSGRNADEAVATLRDLAHGLERLADQLARPTGDPAHCSAVLSMSSAPG